MKQCFMKKGEMHTLFHEYASEDEVFARNKKCCHTLLLVPLMDDDVVRR
jgi:hypothetical protein